MRKYLLAAAAAAAIASPAAAQTGPYVGVEGGLLFPRDLNGNVMIDYTAGGLTDVNSNEAFEVDFKRGRDLDIIGGYDFGMFRVEGEIAWKRAKLDNIEFDDDFADDFEDAGFDDEDFDLDGTMKVRSLMINGLFDFGLSDNLSAFVGAGVGRARARLGGQTDKSTALQLLAGVRTAVSDNIDLGLKYRYFRTGRMGFGASENFGPEDIDGDGDMDSGVVSVGTNNRFSSHSLLASLIFNFGAPAVAPVPVVEAPPPPPPAPATQTCPDGSVILATDMCPVPPPPPPPAPAPAGERG